MNTFNIANHLNEITANGLRVVSVQRDGKMFKGRYTVPSSPHVDFPFRFYPNESIPTLLRLKYIDDTTYDGREIQVGNLGEHPTAFEDLKMNWMPFSEWFQTFERNIRHPDNFAGQVLTDMARKVSERASFYTQNRFMPCGFAGLPWFGMLLHYEARRNQPNNLRWIKEAHEQQTEPCTPEYIWQLITEKTPL